jgi:cytochrome P450
MSTPSQEMACMAREPHIPLPRANPRQMGGEDTNEKQAACRQQDERSMMMSTTQQPCFLFLARDPYPYYQRMREQQPVVYDQNRDVWFVFRYEDAERVFTEYETFSSQAWCCEFNNVLYYTFTRMDPPQMQQYRSLVSHAFTPRAVAQLPEQITLLATQLLSRVAEAGQMDVVEDLALPLPLLVMRDLLGLPPEDDARLLPWARSNAQLGDGPFPPEMRSYLLDLISRQQQRLRPGVIQSLLEARLEGRPLTEAELLGFCGMLFATANTEMTPFLGNVVQGLLEHPGLAEELRANPDLVPGAIEELLRFYPPIPETSPRGTTRAVELSGQSIAAGQRVVPMIASANRDDTMFADPDRFDIRRTPNPHLSMSTGPHVCLGAHLARLETQVVLSVLLAHLEDLQLVPGATLVPAGMFGVKHLPITFRWHSGSPLAQVRKQPDPQVSAGSQCPLPAHCS